MNIAPLHRNAKEFYQEFSVNLKKYYRQQEKIKWLRTQDIHETELWLHVVQVLEYRNE